MESARCVGSAVETAPIFYLINSVQSGMTGPIGVGKVFPLIHKISNCLDWMVSAGIIGEGDYGGSIKFFIINGWCNTVHLFNDSWNASAFSEVVK